MAEYDKIISVNIEDEMKRDYIDYAMSVIIARAIPDIRDGLKPVHRRILYAMNELNLDPSGGYKKSARIVGDTMGKYHPHGDAAIYDALVRLAQDFSMRYPLVDGHGNFGSIDGYQAAAQRYTEAKFAKLSLELLRDIDKNTIDFMPNYDGEFQEPTVLPSRFPNLLVNGSSGIAVGMATNIPPHNLKEVVAGIVKIIDNKINEDRDTEIEEILPIIKGPDFPTGATILGKAGIREAYLTGKGKLRLRATAEIEELSNGRERIIVTEIPYQVNKARMIERIADLVKEKKVEGISGILDESDRNGIRISIDIKKDANANIVLNKLYMFSQLQETYSINFLTIVDGVPKVLNLLQILEYYLKFQQEVVRRRTEFDLDKALKRSHILEGLIVAHDNIDEVIKIIRSSKTPSEAKERLTERFGLTNEQTSAIIEMRLRALTGLEKDKLENEFKTLQELIGELKSILADEKKLLSVIREEISAIGNKYGDERRTKIVVDAGEIDIEDLIDDEMNVITMTHFNYIKRTPLSTYKSQRRGGKGITGLKTRQEDYAESIFLSQSLANILFFTDKGKVYRLKAYEIAEAGRTAKGTPIINLLPVEQGEKINAVIPVSEEFENGYLMMVTKRGIIKKTDVNKFSNIRKSGLIAVNLKEDDELISVMISNGEEDVFVVTKNGLAIRFNEKDVRDMGRNATGVRAIKLGSDDFVVSASIIKDGFKALIVSEKGFGKCTQTEEYRQQSRGGKGVKSYKITEKTGNIVGAEMVNENEELMLINSEGVIIRLRIKDISTTSRVTQGVKLINLEDDVTVVSMAKIPEEALEDEKDEITSDETEVIE